MWPKGASDIISVIQWKPIDTAPKEVWILLYHRNYKKAMDHKISKTSNLASYSHWAKMPHPPKD